MMKYDFEVDLSENSSTGLILNKIKRESIVLEFGCANGRMTKYMKETLNCQVYIVEIDHDAYETAKQYAAGGVCDDILNFSWLEKFKEIQFDVIIFADVLEHLTKPKDVLKKAGALLKKEGHVYISIPNITHNDILLKAMEEHFDYTDVGLLDDTHVHFWGLENIADFVKDSGLHLFKLEATYCPLGKTEQYSDRQPEVEPFIINYLNDRLCGGVYQFVLSLDTCSDETEIDIKKSFIKSHVYLDTGNGFEPDECIEFETEAVGNCEYIVHCVIENNGKIRQIRFDPVELQECIISYLTVRQGDEELKLNYVDPIQLGRDILLHSKDPMVIADIRNQQDAIIIDANIILPGRKYLERVTNACAEKSHSLESLEKEKNDLLLEQQNIKKENEERKKTAEQLRLEREYLQEENEKKADTLQQLQQNMAGLQRRNEELQETVNAYVALVNRKDELLIELERSGWRKRLKVFCEKLKKRIKNVIKRLG